MPSCRVEACLRCAVRGPVGKRTGAGKTADVDNPAATTRAQQRQGTSDTEERAGEVCVDDLAPLFQRGVLDRSERTNAGVVHQDVQPAKFSLHGGKQLRHLVIAAHISADAPRAWAKSSGCCGNCRVAGAGDHNAGAGSDQGAGSGISDSPGSPGHDRDLPVEHRHGAITIT